MTNKQIEFLTNLSETLTGMISDPKNQREALESKVQEINIEILRLQRLEDSFRSTTSAITNLLTSDKQGLDVDGSLIK